MAPSRQKNSDTLVRCAYDPPSQKDLLVRFTKAPTDLNTSHFCIAFNLTFPEFKEWRAALHRHLPEFSHISIEVDDDGVQKPAPWWKLLAGGKKDTKYHLLNGNLIRETINDWKMRAFFA